MKELHETQKKIVRAVRTMDDKSAVKLWNIISEDFQDAAAWALIPEEEPDDFDLYMLEQIENDPDCHEFISSEELKRELGLIENENRVA